MGGKSSRGRDSWRNSELNEVGIVREREEEKNGADKSPESSKVIPIADNETGPALTTVDIELQWAPGRVMILPLPKKKVA